MVPNLDDFTQLDNLVVGGQGRSAEDLYYSASLIALITFPVWGWLLIPVGLYELYKGVYDIRKRRKSRRANVSARYRC